MRTQTAKIEKRVPIPDIHKDGAGRPWRFPFPKMEVGDSFLFPKKMTSNRVGPYVQYAKRALGRTFSVRTTPQGVRCWRVK